MRHGTDHHSFVIFPRKLRMRLLPHYNKLRCVTVKAYAPFGELASAVAARALPELERLDGDLRRELARLPADRRLLVSCEGAFSYLARDYSLQEAWLWPVNGEQEVTPRRMRRLIDTVRQRQVPAVFCESTVDAGAMRRVAAESGARFAGTFHVESLSPAGGNAPTYQALMRHNVDLLLRGLAAR
jgi:manganese transport system substrate-binding protein